jgi:hypothetical protein
MAYKGGEYEVLLIAPLQTRCWPTFQLPLLWGIFPLLIRPMRRTVRQLCTVLWSSVWFSICDYTWPYSDWAMGRTIEALRVDCWHRQGIFFQIETSSGALTQDLPSFGIWRIMLRMSQMGRHDGKSRDSSSAIAQHTDHPDPGSSWVARIVLWVGRGRSFPDVCELIIHPQSCQLVRYSLAGDAASLPKTKQKSLQCFVKEYANYIFF